MFRNVDRSKGKPGSGSAAGAAIKSARKGRSGTNDNEPYKAIYYIVPHHFEESMDC